MADKKHRPKIIWKPGPVRYGTPLADNTHLNAQAIHEGKQVPGEFEYSHARGTLLQAGKHTLKVTWNPKEDENYEIVEETVEVECEKMKLTASIIGNPTKPYDGTTSATLTPANFQLSGLVGTDSFTVTQTAGTYNSPNVATASSVTARLTAGDFTPAEGMLASNYTLPTTASGPGQITAVTLTAAIVGNPTKPYDGTTSATLTPANFQLSGLVGTDSFTVTQAAGTYNSPNVATASSVTASLTGGNFTANGATLASNYNLPLTASGSGQITAVTLTAAIVGNPTKPYDGTTSATLTPANFQLSGLVGTDSFTVTQAAGTYNSPNVATASSVTASLTGGNFTANGTTLASNYNLPLTASGSGQITAATPKGHVSGATFAAFGVDGKTPVAGRITLSLAEGTAPVRAIIEFKSTDTNYADPASSEILIPAPVFRDITGMIKTRTGAAVAGYSVKLWDVRAEKFVGETITDPEGRYRIPARQGFYKVLAGGKETEVTVPA